MMKSVVRLILFAYFVIFAGCKKDESLPFTGKWLVVVSYEAGTVSDEVIMNIVQIPDNKITGTYDFVNSDNKTEEIVESQISGQSLSFSIDIERFSPYSKFHFSGMADKNYQTLSGTWQRMNMDCNTCNGSWLGEKVE